MASSGNFLATLMQDADRTSQQEAAELWPDQSKQVLPVVQSLSAEIGTDQLLGEAALAWVRMKKQELMAAALGVYYTPAQLEAMRAKAAESN